MKILTFDKYVELIDAIIYKPFLLKDSITDLIQLLVAHTPIALQELHLQRIIRTSPLEYNEVCKHVDRCSYNPDVSGIPLQRCNVKGQQVLYASVPCETETFKDDAMLPSILETCFQKIQDDPDFDNKLIVVSEWLPQRPLLVWSLPFHTTSITKNKIFKQLYEDAVRNIELLSKTETDKEKYLQQFSYLSSLYCKKDAKENIYKFTSAFHNQVMRHMQEMKGITLDGLIYPAAYSAGEAMSIVLNKQVVVSKAVICKYARLQFINRDPYDEKNIKIDVYAEAFSDECGNLDFKPIKVK